MVKRLLQLLWRPSDAWTEIAAESGRPADLLLPVPAILVAIAPVCFLIGHCLIGAGEGRTPLGRGLAWAAVYYALVVACLLGQALLLRRLGPVLGFRILAEDALKLSVYAGSPFLVAGVIWIVPVVQWESAVVVAGMVGGGYGGFLLYKGLAVFARSETGSRGLVAAAGAGGFLVAWVLGFFLLKKIVL